MKKIIKIIAAFLVIMLIGVLVFLKTAAGDKNIYISTGFNKNVMVKVDQTETTLTEVMILLSDMVYEYEQTFGESIWEETMDGMPFEQFITDQVRGKITRIKCMNQVALGRGIVLSNLEEQAIGKAANEYMEGVDKASLKKYDFTVEDVKELYRSILLADKLFDDLTYSVDTEISEDEARVITIQYIKTDSYEKAFSMKTRLDGGESFTSLVRESNPYEYEYELRRGETEEVFEETAYNLVTGQVSDIVQAGGAYYIIMCVNEYDKIKTAANKQEMIEKNKLDKFNEIFEPYEAALYAEYNEELWSTISMEDYIRSSVGFQEAYDKYMK